MQYIGFWIRLVAFIIDAIVLNVIQIPFNLLLGGGMWGGQGENANLLLVISLTIGVLYWVVFQHKYTQTLGKKVMGIKVVDASGKTPSMMTLFLREIIGKFVSAIILFIGYLMIAWDSKKQGLHDKIASTYVVKAK